MDRGNVAVLTRIWNLVLKEFIQFYRDWLMTAFILTLPVLQLVLLARATGARISDMRVAVLDLDRSSASRQLVTALDQVRLADYHRIALAAVKPPAAPILRAWIAWRR